ncbi:hypothetical protein Lqui_1584 [Legionella quinlivanii]|uniref:Uncharacterized protein n=2 Tax=Legionellaceae TaxID=444 RepID=A0A0W0Y152_9GAMM|nr:hypothetical protein Lqui_1584 [Legionella quinlivanii]SEF45606.1 hypothetical protein SAMN02746093_00247 [Legionella quinlivanii DSM 21216]STY11858.1 Uncharacterised protein [Legionella quinlivanii]
MASVYPIIKENYLKIDDALEINKGRNFAMNQPKDSPDKSSETEEPTAVESADDKKLDTEQDEGRLDNKERDPRTGDFRSS